MTYGHIRMICYTLHFPLQGAGDAFVGALAYYLSKDSYATLPMKEKLRRACHIASYSVTKEGTQTSYPWKDDLNQELF